MCPAGWPRGRARERWYHGSGQWRHHGSGKRRHHGSGGRWQDGGARPRRHVAPAGQDRTAQPFRHAPRPRAADRNVVEGSRRLRLGDQRIGAVQRGPEAAAEIPLPDHRLAVAENANSARSNPAIFRRRDRPSVPNRSQWPAYLSAVEPVKTSRNTSRGSAVLGGAGRSTGLGRAAPGPRITSGRSSSALSGSRPAIRSRRIQPTLPTAPKTPTRIQASPRSNSISLRPASSRRITGASASTKRMSPGVAGAVPAPRAVNASARAVEALRLVNARRFRYRDIIGRSECRRSCDTS